MAKLFGNPDQKYSMELLKAVNDLREYKRSIELRRDQAIVKVDNLQEELEGINLEYLSEQDPDKLAELYDKRKRLFFEIEDSKLISNIDVSRAIAPRLSAESAKFEELVSKAEAEYKAFAEEIEEKIKVIEQQAKNEIEKLRELKSQHASLEARRKYYDLRSSLR